MVHSAYDSVELVKSCPAKIETVAVYDSKLIVGCSDCSLRIYAPPSGDDGDGEIRRGLYELEKTVTGFWKKAPVAMEVCRSRDLLLSLSEWIAVHRLPNLETVVAIAKTKGGNVFTWDDRRGFLAVGRQKRVGIYRLDGKFLFIFYFL